MTTPARTAEQRSDALAGALAVRKERARLRRALKAREISGVDVLEGADGNPVWASLKVIWLLECLPGVGAVRADRILSAIDIARSRRVQGLGVRQRAALIAELTRDGR